MSTTNFKTGNNNPRSENKTNTVAHDWNGTSVTLRKYYNCFILIASLTPFTRHNSTGIYLLKVNNRNPVPVYMEAEHSGEEIV